MSKSDGNVLDPDAIIHGSTLSVSGQSAGWYHLEAMVHVHYSTPGAGERAADW